MEEGDGSVLAIEGVNVKVGFVWVTVVGCREYVKGKKGG